MRTTEKATPATEIASRPFSASRFLLATGTIPHPLLRPHVAADGLHHLADVGIAVAAADSFGHTATDMVLQEDLGDGVGGGAEGGGLLQDGHAGTGLLHHAADTAGLPLDAVQPGDEGGFVLGVRLGSSRSGHAHPP